MINPTLTQKVQELAAQLRDSPRRAEQSLAERLDRLLKMPPEQQQDFIRKNITLADINWFQFLINLYQGMVNSLEPIEFEFQRLVDEDCKQKADEARECQRIILELFRIGWTISLS